MKVTDEVAVPLVEKADLAAMMRDYIAEMATLIANVDPDRPYPYFDLYWSEPETRRPFWLRVADSNAGFALLDLKAGEGRTEIAEFYVARGFRRRGIGRGAARRLIARFPGGWRITQREENAPAIAFWHGVLDGFVTYREVTTRTDAVRREQHFSVS